MNRVAHHQPGKPSGPTPAQASDEDVAVFERCLAPFVPPDVFDVHVHLFVADHGLPLPTSGSTVIFDDWSTSMRSWMRDRAPNVGLFFGFPSKASDPGHDNALVESQLKGCLRHPRSCGTRLLRGPHPRRP